MNLILALLLVCIVVMFALQRPVQRGGVSPNDDPYYVFEMEPFSGNTLTNTLTYSISTGNVHAIVYGPTDYIQYSFFPNTVAQLLPGNIIHMKTRLRGGNMQDHGQYKITTIPPYIHEFMEGIKGVTHAQKKALTAKIITSDTGTIRYPNVHREFQVKNETLRGTRIMTLFSINYQSHEVKLGNNTISLRFGDHIKVHRKGRRAVYSITINRGGRQILSTDYRKMNWKRFFGLSTTLYPLNVKAGTVARIFGEYQFGRILERCLNEAVPSS